MPLHRPPLGLIRDEIELICRALEFFQTHAALLPLEQTNLPALRGKLETEVPFFPCYLLAWPGVTADEMAPVLSDASGMSEHTPPPCEKCGGVGYDGKGRTCNACNDYELTILQGTALNLFVDRAEGCDVLSFGIYRDDFEAFIRERSSFTARDATGFVDDLISDNLLRDRSVPESRKAVALAPRGLAALDAWRGKRKGEATLSEGSREGSGIVRKERPEDFRAVSALYGQPMGKRSCPVCKGTGDTGDERRGLIICRECHGSGSVLEMSPQHVGEFLTDALEHFQHGRGSQAFGTLCRVVAHLAERVTTCETCVDQANATADAAHNRASMRDNGIQPD